MFTVPRPVALAATIAFMTVPWALPAVAYAADEPPAWGTGFADDERVPTSVSDLSVAASSAGSREEIEITGRLVEAATLLFPLGRVPVTVDVTGEAGGTAVAQCNTSTARDGTFRCTITVTARPRFAITVHFGGNQLFAASTVTCALSAKGEMMANNPVAAAHDLWLAPAPGSMTPMIGAEPTLAPFLPGPQSETAMPGVAPLVGASDGVGGAFKPAPWSPAFARSQQ